MSLDYLNNAEKIIDRLKIAHNPKIAKIRGHFFKKENNFFKRKIRNKKVLVAGSGLGHDSFELAKFNRKIIGIEIIPLFIKKAESKLSELPLKNVAFIKGDFTKIRLERFDVAILNMGTIGNFKDKEKVIDNLLNLADKLYLDFYPPTKKGLEKRRKMYSEELWKNVEIKDKAIISDDGLESVSISKKEMDKIIKNIGAKVKYYKITNYSLMAEITKESL